MTILSIVLVLGVLLFGIIAGGYLLIAAKKERDKTSFAVGITIIVLAIIASTAMCWWQLNSESGRRAYKTQQSNLNGGISRVVRVYDVEGKEIVRYEGKFDVGHNANDNKIMFDDENGKRHIVYYTTGTVTVDEK